jgi:hypothetical protein
MSLQNVEGRPGGAVRYLFGHPQILVQSMCNVLEVQLVFARWRYLVGRWPDNFYVEHWDVD